MNTALITLSSEGYGTAERIRRNGLQGADIFIPEGVLERSYTEESRITMFREGVGELTTTIFTRYKNLIYIMPLGIVMRTIAPHLSSKHSDPAVVTVDISGRWVISALSGHEGGANKLAELTARALNTDFIVTTSTEARKNLILGVGCRKNIEKEDIERAVHMALQKLRSNKDEIRLIATIERKRSIGEMSVIDITTRSVTAIARSKTALASLPQKAFNTILDRHPKTGIKILKGIARLMSLNMRKTSSRLADYMLPMS